MHVRSGLSRPAAVGRVLLVCPTPKSPPRRGLLRRRRRRKKRGRGSDTNARCSYLFLFSQSSVRMPCVDLGCRKAMVMPSAPLRGRIVDQTDALGLGVGQLLLDILAGKRHVMECRHRVFSMYLAMVDLGRSGSSSSILVCPSLKNAVRTFWSATSSTHSTFRPKTFSQ